MTIFKISGKQSNLSLKLTHPLFLKENKKYSLGVFKILLEGYSNQLIRNFTYDLGIKLDKFRQSKERRYSISGLHSIGEIRNILLENIKDFKEYIVKEIEKEITPKKDDQRDSLLKYIEIVKNIDTSKLKLEVINQNQIKFCTPFKMFINHEDSNFCDVFGFSKCINFEPNTDYTSELNPSYLSAPLLELHCDLIESSYHNHESNPHIHTIYDLLYIDSMENAFKQNTKYVITPKKVLYVPLKEDIRKIRDITLRLFDEEYNKIRNIENVIVYLQLNEN